MTSQPEQWPARLTDAGMRAELEKLPPGHPSSPRTASGARRPPPPRPQDLELPLPGTWAGAPENDPRPGPAWDDREIDALPGEPPAVWDAS